MKTFRSLAWLILMFPLLASAQQLPTTIEIFVDQPMSPPAIPNANVFVFDLSQVDAVTRTAPQFSPDEQSAQISAEAWLKSEAGARYVENLKRAYAGRIKMISYGVLKLPAIVFENGKYVVYGTSDVLKAVADYDHFKKMHPSHDGYAGDSTDE